MSKRLDPNGLAGAFAPAQPASLDFLVPSKPAPTPTPEPAQEAAPRPRMTARRKAVKAEPAPEKKKARKKTARKKKTTARKKTTRKKAAGKKAAGKKTTTRARKKTARTRKQPAITHSTPVVPTPPAAPSGKYERPAARFAPLKDPGRPPEGSPPVAVPAAPAGARWAPSAPPSRRSLRSRVAARAERLVGRILCLVLLPGPFAVG